MRSDLRVSVASSGQLGSIGKLLNATAQALVAQDVAVPGPLDIDMATLPGEWKVADIKKAGGTAMIHWRVSWTKDPDEPDGSEVGGYSIEVLNKRERMR